MRLLMILVLALAAAALGLIASNAYRPKTDAPTAQLPPAAEQQEQQYLVAAHPLQAGAWLREEDFAALPAAAILASVPAGSIDLSVEAYPDKPDKRAMLRGSLIRKFIAEKALIKPDDVMRPQDRGFLASVLAPGTRAVSISVDAESGVSGLVWPGDLVDVVLTQTNEKGTQASHRALSEIVLRNIRVVATDQDIQEGVPANSSAAGKTAHSVSLQLEPKEVKVIAVARTLGRLSLAVAAAPLPPKAPSQPGTAAPSQPGTAGARPETGDAKPGTAGDEREPADTGVTFDCDVSTDSSRHATVMIYAGGAPKAFSVSKADGQAPVRGCDPPGDVARTDGGPTGSSDGASNREEKR